MRSTARAWGAPIAPRREQVVQLLAAMEQRSRRRRPTATRSRWPARRAPSPIACAAPRPRAAAAPRPGRCIGVSALSGYCEAGHGRVAFSILMNSVDVDAARRAQDRMAAADRALPLSRRSSRPSAQLRAARALSRRGQQLAQPVLVEDRPRPSSSGLGAASSRGCRRRPRSRSSCETEPVTLPPARRISSVASSRESSGRVPVSTNVLPSSGPPSARRSAAESSKRSPRSRSRRISSSVGSSASSSRTCSARIGPTPSTSSISLGDRPRAARRSSRSARPAPAR